MLLPDLTIAELVIRSAVVYLFLFVLLRFIGKKHVGQMSPSNGGLRDGQKFSCATAT